MYICIYKCSNFGGFKAYVSHSAQQHKDEMFTWQTPLVTERHQPKKQQLHLQHCQLCSLICTLQ